jgi:serine/threonine protein phosphatase PrpC
MSAGSLVRATIGQYRLIELIGAGGMGEVYRGVHVRTGGTVAVKVLIGAAHMPKYLERFRNEARIQAQLRHPNIAALYDFMEYDQTPCIVMELVDGETLEQLVERRGALPVDEVVRLSADVVDAVRYLHDRNIIHRDIKLSNAKVDASGAVRLLDFGIAKGPGSPALTTVGSVIGTLQALAPEQLDGAPASERTDIWSLGVLVYELATGRHPFAADGADGITARIRAASFTLPSRVATGLPAEIDDVVARCLRAKPRDRYASCADLLHDLRAIADARRRAADHATAGRPVRFPRLQLNLAIGAAGVAAALLVASLVTKPATARKPVAPTPVPGAANTSAPRASVIPAGSAAPDATERTVTVNIITGTADVWREGKLVGQTPYHVTAPIGEHVALVLRQAGHEDEPVAFDVTEGRTEYSILMRPRMSPTPNDPPLPDAAIATLGWFVLPWRRRRRAVEASLTVERPAMEDASGLGVESRIIVGIATDPGCVRQENEDTIRVIRYSAESRNGAGLLAIVLDGMGGHAAGEVASRVAADELEREFTDSTGDAGEALVNAIRAANRAVIAAAKTSPDLAGMGTTCTALVVRQGLAWCAHVGDSRCYLVRDDEIFLMTEDHSAVMAMVRDGSLSLEQARQHPDKNVISRALGSRLEVEVTTWPRPFVVRPGDRFFLCSDGLYDVVGDDELRDVVRSLDPLGACERLVALAKEHGAPDNVSVAVLAVPEQFGDHAARTTRDLPILP